MKLTIKILIGILTVGFLGLFLAQRLNLTPSSTVVEFRNVNVTAEVAATAEARKQGLSGRKELGEKQGMLFILSKPDFHHFHMKDMNFPIDIIWLDENLRVVDITAQLDPDTYPQTFTSHRPAQYALEVNAGFADEYGIVRGDKAVIDQSHLDNWLEQARD